MLGREYIKIIENEHILQAYDIKKLTIITIEEYEMIMDLIKSGCSFVDIINNKNADPDFKYESMKNFLLFKKYYKKNFFQLHKEECDKILNKFSLSLK